MKIYNEITLEWNEDTKRYDKVVSEDSYEYDGELELAQYGTFAPAGRFKAGTMGRQTQWDLIDAAEEQAEKQAGHFGLGSIFSFITSTIMTSMGVPYPVAKGITDSLVAATYKPETFKSKTGWGTKRYEQLSERDTRAKSRAFEKAGMGTAQNLLLSFVYPELFEGMETKLKGSKPYKAAFGPTAPPGPNVPPLDKQWTGAGFKDILKQSGVEIPGPFHRGLGQDALKKLTEVVRPGGVPIELPFNFEEELEFPSDAGIWGN